MQRAPLWFLNNNSPLLHKAPSFRSLPHTFSCLKLSSSAQQLIVFYRKCRKMRARSTRPQYTHSRILCILSILCGLNIYKKSFVWVWDCVGFSKNCNEQASKEIKILGILRITIRLLTMLFPVNWGGVLCLGIFCANISLSSRNTWLTLS